MMWRPAPAVTAWSVYAFSSSMPGRNASRGTVRMARSTSEGTARSLRMASTSRLRRQVTQRSGGGGRLVLAVDVSPWLRSDAPCSAERLFCHVYGRAKTASQFIPGWPYSFVARWAASSASPRSGWPCPTARRRYSCGTRSRPRPRPAAPSPSSAGGRGTSSPHVLAGAAADLAYARLLSDNVEGAVEALAPLWEVPAEQRKTASSSGRPGSAGTLHGRTTTARHSWRNCANRSRSSPGSRRRTDSARPRRSWRSVPDHREPGDRTRGAPGRRSLTGRRGSAPPSPPRSRAPPAGQHRSQSADVDPAVVQAAVHRSVPTRMLTQQRQVYRRLHRTVRAQHRVHQLEQLIAPGGQTLVELALDA